MYRKSSQLVVASKTERTSVKEPFVAGSTYGVRREGITAGISDGE
jgi:hypothetical protein